MKCLYLFIFSLLVNFVLAQNQVVNQPFNGNTHYDKSSHIKKIIDLPDSVVLKLNNHLDNIFGDLKEFMKFSHGQIVYSEDIIKYDLNFQIEIISLGIKSFYIQIKLTEDCKITSINWPVTEYNRNILYERPITTFCKQLCSRRKNL